MYNFKNMASIKNTINECRNILQYCLFLKFDQSLFEADSEVAIENILKSTFENCISILNEGDLRFFGKQPEEETYSGILAELSTLPSFNIIWKKIIYQHCLFATYDKLQSLLFGQYGISFYGLADFYQSDGFDYVLKNMKPKFIPDDITPNNDTPTNRQASGKEPVGSISNSYKNSIEYIDKQRLRNLNFLSDLYLDKENNKKSTSKLIKASYIVPTRILVGRGRTLRNVSKLYSSQTAITPSAIEKYMDTASEIIEEPMKGCLDTTHMERSDHLYYKYKVEQIFNFNLIDCLARNIDDLQKKHNVSIDASIIGRLSSCAELPNLFSRHLLLQMAFDSFNPTYKINQSCLHKWLSDQLQTWGSYLPSSVDTIRPYQYLGLWLEQYEEFMRYLSIVAFPVYENYFFVTLYDYCKNSSADLNSTFSKMYGLLSEYLCQKETDYSIGALEKDVLKMLNDSISPSKPEINKEEIIKPTFHSHDIHMKHYFQTVLSVYNNAPTKTPAFLSQKYLKDHFRFIDKKFFLAFVSGMVN